VPQFPLVYSGCGEMKSEDINGKTLSEYFSGNFSQLLLEKIDKNHLFVEVPIGYDPHKGYIFVFTIGLTLGLSVFLSKLIITETRSF
jgi:hypothetical protein